VRRCRHQIRMPATATSISLSPGVVTFRITVILVSWKLSVKNSIGKSRPQVTISVGRSALSPRTAPRCSREYTTRRLHQNRFPARQPTVRQSNPAPVPIAMAWLGNTSKEGNSRVGGWLTKGNDKSDLVSKQCVDLRCSRLLPVVRDLTNLRETVGICLVEHRAG